MPVSAHDVQDAFRAGGTAVPLVAAVRALQTASVFDAGALYRTLVEGLPDVGDSLTQATRDACLDALPPRPDDAVDGPRWDELRRLLLLPAPDAPGRVMALLAAPSVAFEGKPLGASHTLVVSVGAHGGGAPLSHPRAGSHEAELINGFVAGTEAARKWVVTRLGGADPLMDSLVWAWNIKGELPTLKAPATGESLGLAAAVGSVSALLDLPVPSDLAFTGRIDAHANLYAVTHIGAKARAAMANHARRLFLPASCRETPDLFPILQPVRTLDDVLVDVFGSDALDVSLARLRAQRPTRLPVRHWESGKPDPRPRALVSFVGKSDPMGLIKDTAGKAALWQEDGPVLACVRHMRPAVVHLFYTTGSGHETDANNFAAKAVEVQQAVQTLYPDQAECRVESHPLDGVTDPTDIEALFVKMGEKAAPLSEALAGDFATFVNTSSGTGQMLFVLAVLNRTGVLPGTLIQARERRWAERDGQPRVRKIDLPELRQATN